MGISEEDYIKERLDDQINWYDKKSMYAQKVYKRLKGLVMLLSASIPFFVGFIADFHKHWEYLVSGIGVIIVCIEGWLGLSKHHENWIEYRAICETLRHERYMYLTKTGVYEGDNPFKLLVERVESIISKENLNWAGINSQDGGE